MDDIVIKDVGISGVCGFVTGYAVKQVGRALILVGGLAFIGLQYAKHEGYVEVDYKKLNDKFGGICDVNKDGQVNGDDFKQIAHRFSDYLGVGLPSLTAFGTCFMMGLYVG